jgi:hypothetical protein
MLAWHPKSEKPELEPNCWTKNCSFTWIRSFLHEWLMFYLFIIVFVWPYSRGIFVFFCWNIKCQCQWNCQECQVGVDLTLTRVDVNVKNFPWLDVHPMSTSTSTSSCKTWRLPIYACNWAPPCIWTPLCNRAPLFGKFIRRKMKIYLVFGFAGDSWNIEPPGAQLQDLRYVV